MRRPGPLVTFALLMALWSFATPLATDAPAWFRQPAMTLLLGIFPGGLLAAWVLRPALLESSRDVGEWTASALLLPPALLVVMLPVALWQWRDALRAWPDALGWLATLLLVPALLLLLARLAPDLRGGDERRRLAWLGGAGLVLLLVPLFEPLRLGLLVGVQLAAFYLLAAYAEQDRARPSGAFRPLLAAAFLLVPLLLALPFLDRLRVVGALVLLVPPLLCLLLLVLPARLAERRP